MKVKNNLNARFGWLVDAAFAAFLGGVCGIGLYLVLAGVVGRVTAP